jgi:hypothetical protein
MLDVLVQPRRRRRHDIPPPLRLRVGCDSGPRIGTMEKLGDLY